MESKKSDNTKPVKSNDIEPAKSNDIESEKTTIKGQQNTIGNKQKVII